MQRKNGHPIYSPRREAADRQPEQVRCRRGPMCDGCPFPGHGFICWSADGSCLRQNYRRKEETPIETDSGA